MWIKCGHLKDALCIVSTCKIKWLTGFFYDTLVFWFGREILEIIIIHRQSSLKYCAFKVFPKKFFGGELINLLEAKILFACGLKTIKTFMLPGQVFFKERFIALCFNVSCIIILHFANLFSFLPKHPYFFLLWHLFLDISRHVLL